MASSIKRPIDRKTYQYEVVIDGARVRKSTKQTQKHLAEKVQRQWDILVLEGDYSFLGNKTSVSGKPREYLLHYLAYREERVVRNKSIRTTKYILDKFVKWMIKMKIMSMDILTVVDVESFLSSLSVSAKTKRNYLVEIRLMLKQAKKESVVKENVALDADPPRGQKSNLHRVLTPQDLKVIFQNAGKWKLYYMFLYHTGLRAGDVALLRTDNIDFRKKRIVSLIRKSRKVHEFPLPDVLWDEIRNVGTGPLFPELYSEKEMSLNDRLKKPRKHMQSILNVFGQEKATLHSFRHTFNTVLRDVGLGIGDRQALLAHASSSTTEIYTHPNLELARRYINRIPLIEPN